MGKSHYDELEKQLTLKQIGIVRTNASDDEIRSETPGSQSEVEIFPEYSEALDGLEGFSHIFVLGYFHKLRPEQVGPLKIRPKRLVRHGLKLEDLPIVGDFTLDSPTRPNPIGLSLVPLLRIDQGTKLIVTDLEYFDGTPVLDIKPYQAGYRVERYSIPRWNSILAEKAGLPPSRSI